MSRDTPRWEYRIWRDVPSVLPAGRTEERTDIYLLRPGLGARLVKLREGRFDVKDLHDTAQGMELWQPRTARGFPLSAGQVAAALCLDPKVRRCLDRRFEGAATLLAALDRCSDVGAVALHKRRVRWTEADCPGETVQVLFRDAWYESRALEHEDPAVVDCALTALDWHDLPNVNYGAWLARALAHDQPAMTRTSA